MDLTLEDVYQQSSFLMNEAGLYINFQNYDEETGLDLEFDGGATYKVLPLDTPVEVFSDGTISIDGDIFRAYLAHQVRF